MSKKSGEKAMPDIDLEAKAKYTVELKAYEEACKVDPDVKNFDNVVQARTGQVMRAVANGVQVQSLSLDSLKEVTSCLLEMDQEVVKLVLQNKEDVWKSPELFELVEEYFNNSLRTLDFCSMLENCLRKARDNQLIIQIALQHIPPGGPPPGEAQYKKILEELGNFKNAGSPFPEDFIRLFESVYTGHIQMLEKLHAKRHKLDKKMKNVKAWKKVSSVIFVATFAAVLICSVVAAAIAAPPIASALAAAAAIPIGSVGKWVDNLWKKYEDTIRGQRELISSMHVGTFVALKDLDNIRVLVDHLEITISSILRSVELGLKDEDAVQVVMDDIRKKQQSFIDEIDRLSDYVDRCSRDIRQARTLVVLKIIRPSRKRSEMGRDEEELNLAGGIL
ncbi:hypothetical protein SUGI_0438140 [Cryptomeria japonica]|nr:hypothetical protein SUGI_0438140 [Cryptomeria japonica]